MISRIVVSLGLLVLLLAGSEWTVRAHHERLDRQRHDAALLHGAEMRARLESALNSTVFLAQGLVAYVVGVESPAEPQVSRALRAVFEADRKIRNIGLAPDNELRFIYPLKGNEKALGLRYADLPQQWPSVRKAIESRQSVLAGPVQLVQGGVGIINRTPVFREDGSYWGLISTVIDLDALIRHVKIDHEVGEMRYWLYGDNGDSPTDTLIIGDRDAVDPKAIRMKITVPGGSWTLLSAPTPELARHHAEIAIIRAVLYAGAIFIAGFTLALMTSRANARQLAQQLGLLNRELVTSNQELHSLSQHDPLTKLPNRRSFDAALQQAWRVCMREGHTVSILMVDIDHFKSINDSYGHAAGDAALVDVSAAIQAQVRRADDILARYGGEEFIVLTTGVSAEETAALAERIRLAVGAYRIQPSDRSDEARPMTVSIGTATMVPTPGHRPYALIERADRAIYAAKHAGRNRVVCADALPPATGGRA